MGPLDPHHYLLLATGPTFQEFPAASGPSSSCKAGSAGQGVYAEEEQPSLRDDLEVCDVAHIHDDNAHHNDASDEVMYISDARMMIRSPNLGGEGRLEA